MRARHIVPARCTYISQAGNYGMHFLRTSLFAAGLTGLFLLWHDAARDSVPTSAHRHDAMADHNVFGPGHLPQPSLPAPSLDSPVDQNTALPAGELYATEQQDLIINPALLAVFNFYLLAPDSATSHTPLENYLNSRLPAQAARQAMQIAEQYEHYIGAHDQLLAAQNLMNLPVSALDPNRLDSWQQQRLRLRQRLLGEQLEQVWYQNEEAQLQQALDELRQARLAPQPSFAPADPAALLQHTQAMHAVLIKACSALHSI